MDCSHSKKYFYKKIKSIISVYVVCDICKITHVSSDPRIFNFYLKDKLC